MTEPPSTPPDPITRRARITVTYEIEVTCEDRDEAWSLVEQMSRAAGHADFAVPPGVEIVDGDVEEDWA